MTRREPGGQHLPVPFTAMRSVVPRILEDYAAAHSMAPSPLLDELQAHTEAHCALPHMLVGRLEGALLRMLVRVTGARRVLEIGLFTGYSALTMAEALPEDGELISCEIDPEMAAIAQSFFDRSDHGRKIHIRLGAALETIAALPGDRPFDLVFLDADKENYCRYYEAVLPLVRPSGLLVADNVVWSGAVLMPREDSHRALVAFNRMVHEDPRVEHEMVPVHDGVTLIYRR